MDVAQAAEDIRSMRVRGAGKIGRHAAQALGSATWDGRDMAALEKAAAALVAARPTAVSLPNAVEFVMRRVRRAPHGERARVLREAADEFEQRAEGALDALAKHGAALVPDDGGTVLTICHSQGALRPMIEAARQGKAFRVIAFETRPWRQGHLTVRQLHDAGLKDVSIAVDSAAWMLLQEASLVLCGADTVARNGDVINKIGTGGLAVLARERGVPMYSCFETFKLAPQWQTGDDVPIEERESAEVVKTGEVPEGVRIRNPVFDVTPHALLQGYVTELGVLKASDLWPAAKKAWEME